jgi:hypothetical protein
MFEGGRVGLKRQGLKRQGLSPSERDEATTDWTAFRQPAKWRL